ncbi:hypothetical protein [Actinocorallia longicatena]|uniref:Carboxypeptidase regulatory-like domain-containing protein n=1 Tax=Actinocorallia longicatena TaxID=111803 RepID=A0ABP6Q994_9ACTN
MKRVLLSGLAVLTAVPFLSTPAHADPPAPVVKATAALTTSDATRHVGDKVRVKGSFVTADADPATPDVPIADLPLAFSVCGDLGCVPAQGATAAKTGADGLYESDLDLSGVAAPHSYVRVRYYDSVTKEYTDGPATGQFDLRYQAVPVGVTPPRSPIVKNRQVIFKGAFSYRDSALKTVPYQGAVTLLSSADGKTWKAAENTRTDEHGRFWVSAPATVKAQWKVAVDDAVTDGQTEATLVDIKPAVTKVATLHGLTKSATLTLGSKFTIKGRSSLVSPDGTRRPNRRAKVELSTSSDGVHWDAYARTRTDRKGRFSFKAVARNDAHWRIVLPGFTGDATVVPPVECRIFIDTKARTRLSADARPEPVRKGRKLTVKGTLSDLVFGHWKPVRQVRVGIWFKPKGKAWKFAGWAWTGRRGGYTFTTRAVRDGSFQARYHGDGDHYRSTSSADYVDVR